MKCVRKTKNAVNDVLVALRVTYPGDDRCVIITNKRLLLPCILHKRDLITFDDVRMVGTIVCSSYHTDSDIVKMWVDAKMALSGLEYEIARGFLVRESWEKLGWNVLTWKVFRDALDGHSDVQDKKETSDET